ncbi:MULTISPECIES: hypothetical protein [Moorena]|uniref:Uncharacterized protein n=1 Tax=Moorena producens 3L TaxID=489825 RepID=F4XZH2_9CYAN|nr:MULTISPECIES: hypothetical protein [Moorena]NES84450.1 hypothetical protein [Moorena sp. SIO2B7]EGJ29977.1 hypothetical protein LYNGBM3L_57530 [Moorena producens 3L]NEP33281.1 hypothetical protein [Moorena sp. SIO3B2]NEP66875.1 hypothetical protein [Moorena sp. SIO3A5]NEQ05995.1 hypothetical protein [Moorena sp. SIO4E2]
MLVILTDNQVISPDLVCQCCLLADPSGQPRWHQGKLVCAHLLKKLSEKQAQQYECEMGFRLVNME